jgi:uncharacterized protein (DUF58 family)
MTYAKAFESKIRIWAYGILWILLLILSAFTYISTGEPNLWAIIPLLLGLVLFLVAKLSVLREPDGKLTYTFGASAQERMSRNLQWCYYGGYAIMILGFFLAFTH